MGDPRFSIAVAVFLAVALVYPWYSYWVQSHLMARDIEAGVREFSKAVDQEVRQANSQMAQVARESAESAVWRRIAAVRVTGIGEGNPPMAVVDLGESNFMESDQTICRQTAKWLRRSDSGTVIRVQRLKSHGTEAVIQQMTCP